MNSSGVLLPKEAKVSIVLPFLASQFYVVGSYQ